MICEHIEELLPEYLDGELTDNRRRLVEEHLESCASCRAMLLGLRRVDAAVASWPALPDEMRSRLPSIDDGVRRGIRRERLLGPALVVMRRTLSLTVSAAVVLIVAGLSVALLLMGARLDTARQTISNAPSNVAGSLLSQLRFLTESPTPSADQVGPFNRRIATGVVRITVSDYRKTSARTVSDASAIKPVVAALGAARFVRRDRSLARDAATQIYTVELGLKDGSSISLIYLPGDRGPNVEDPGTADWWMARGLDSAMQPLLPYPGAAFDAWQIIRDDVIAAPYGWRPIGNYPDRWPRFSPDGTRIAYLPATGGTESRATRVVVRDLNTGVERDITPWHGFEYSSVQWSPDSRSLAFVKSPARPNQDSRNELWREDADGANPAMLFSRPPCDPPENGPSLGIAEWSDDGRSVELTGTVFGCLQVPPFWIPFDGSTARPATPAPVPTPGDFKPANAKVLASLLNPRDGYGLYVVDGSDVQPGGPGNPNARLTLLRLDLKTRQVVPIATFPQELRDSGTFFSTSRDWVAFGQIPRGQNGRLVAPARITVFRSDGTDVRTIQGQPFYLVGDHFHWVEGGRAYLQALPTDATNQDEGYLYQLDARAGVAQIVTTDWRILDLLAVSNDGRHVAVLRGNPRNPDLHLLTLAPRAGTVDSSTTVKPVPRPATPSSLPVVNPTPAVPVIRQLPAPAISLAADPRNPLVVYALLATNALYRSDDGGQTWRRLPLPATESPYPTPASDQRPGGLLVSNRGIVVAPGNANRVFVVADRVLYGSDDGGTSWKPLNAAVYAWAVGDPTGNVLYAWRGDTVSGRSGLDRSDDGGATWHEVYTGAFPPFLASAPCPCSHEGTSALAVDPRNPTSLYAGTDYGVYHSDDGGKTWTELADGMPASSTRYRWTPALAVTANGTVYALTEISPDATSSHAEVLRLRRGESAWTSVGGRSLANWRSGEASFSGFVTIVADPANPARVYLGTLRGLAVSDDGGETWRSPNLKPGAAVYVVATSSGQPHRLYLWTSDGFVAADAPVH